MDKFLTRKRKAEEEEEEDNHHEDDYDGEDGHHHLHDVPLLDVHSLLSLEIKTLFYVHCVRGPHS
jgi:hypothetical protein